MGQLSLVFSDFDGTLTFRDQLTREFHDIIDLLKGHGVPLVICTGRSKSWAHFLLTHFHDLDYVISEGGGNLSYIDCKSGYRELKDKLLISKEDLAHLQQTTKELLDAFPDLRLSADSYGREADRAIELTDLAEVDGLKEKVEAFLTQKKITFSTSNVHLNFWSGPIHKIDAIRRFAKEFYPVDLNETLYFGDSLNDESAFGGHPRSVGVSNVAKVLDRLKQKPKTILTGDENEGPLGVLNYLTTVLK